MGSYPAFSHLTPALRRALERSFLCGTFHTLTGPPLITGFPVLWCPDFPLQKSSCSDCPIFRQSNYTSRRKLFTTIRFNSSNVGTPSSGILSSFLCLSVTFFYYLFIQFIIISFLFKAILFFLMTYSSAF